MHWVVQENIFAEAGWTSMLEILERFSIPHSVHKVVPFVGELMPDPVLDTDNVICMGSYSMRHIAKKKGWSPGVFDLEPFHFGIQMDRYGPERMLNGDSAVVPFKDAVFTQDAMFVRPIHDSKHFAGRVFSRDEFEEWQTKVVDLKEDTGLSLTADTLVQVAPPKQIFVEARFWIVDGQIVTGSIYKRGSKVLYDRDVDRDLEKFAAGLAKEWSPLRAYCLDVCRTLRGLSVVEINTINSSGFYAADLNELVLTLDTAFSKDRKHAL